MTAPTGWVLCPHRKANGSCAGCTPGDVQIVLSLSLREDVPNSQQIVGHIASLLLELLGEDNPFPTPWVLHMAPRITWKTCDWVITTANTEPTS